jgi:hypothetical protein
MGYLTVSREPQSVTNRSTVASMVRHNRSHAGIDRITSQDHRHLRAYRTGRRPSRRAITIDRMSEWMGSLQTITVAAECSDSIVHTLSGKKQYNGSWNGGDYHTRS